MNTRNPTPRCYRCGKEADGGYCPACDEIETRRFDEAMTFNAMVTMQRIKWHNYLKRLAFQIEGQKAGAVYHSLWPGRVAARAGDNGAMTCNLSHHIPPCLGLS